MLAELLGVPVEDRYRFRSWGDMIAASPTDTTDAAHSEAIERRIEGIEAMSDYIIGLIGEREAAPRDDLLSHMVEADDLGASEIIAFTILLLMAGDKTVATFTSNALWTFIEEDHLDPLLDGRVDLDDALEEVLRYRSPIASTSRMMKTDAKIGGETIPADELVVAWIGSANRDERLFDEPEVFDPTRDTSRHIAFSNGAHTCIGKHLAKIEVTIALEAFLDRVETINVATDDPSPFGSRVVYGLENLPVRYTA